MLHSRTRRLRSLIMQQTRMPSKPHYARGLQCAACAVTEKSDKAVLRCAVKLLRLNCTHVMIA